MRRELQQVFETGCFKLRKWKANERDVLTSIPEDLRDNKTKQEIHHQEGYTKVLGVEWNVVSDCFRPVICTSEVNEEPLTKRVLVSNIARLFNVLGWCSPTIILMKILLQRLWEQDLEWDEPVPERIQSSWKRWHKELPLLKEFCVAHPYFPKDVVIKDLQLHCFCDMLEVEYLYALCTSEPPTIKIMSMWP